MLITSIQLALPPHHAPSTGDSLDNSGDAGDILPGELRGDSGEDNGLPDPLQESQGGGAGGENSL